MTKILSTADIIVDMDKMVSIKGLVIRTTPVIPDMKTGKETSIQSGQDSMTDRLPSIFPLSGLQPRSKCFP